MPQSESQRRLFFAELSRRKKGKKRKLKGISTGKLSKLARSPLDMEAKRKR